MASRLLLFATPIAVLLLVWQVPANTVPVVQDEIRLANVDAGSVDELGNYQAPVSALRDPSDSQAVLAAYTTSALSRDGHTQVVAGEQLDQFETSHQSFEPRSSFVASESPVETNGRREDEHRAATTRPMPSTTLAATSLPIRQPAVDRNNAPFLPAGVATKVAKLRHFSQQYWAEPDRRPQIEPELIAIATEVYGQPEIHFLPSRVVRRGETLASIADEYDLTWEYLADLNGIEPRRLQVGQELKVVPGPFGVIVERSRHQLTVHSNGYVVQNFEVGLGTANEFEETSTPIGRFTIANRITNPTWYGPDGVVTGDDPANPLGEHWLGLADIDGRQTSLGIHGTLAPQTVGHNASHGCIRMRSDDIAALFRLLPIGAVVEIRE